jgi:hypothetical protein
VVLGQRLRRFADHIATTVGTDYGERVRRWFQEKLCRENGEEECSNTVGCTGIP